MFRWTVLPPADEARVRDLSLRTGLSPLIASLVVRRTPDNAAALRWLHPAEQPLCDPFALGDMRAAVAAILEALRSRTPITVFGDYDTDGVTATVLLVGALRRLAARILALPEDAPALRDAVKPFFPSRETEGYGLSVAALTRCFSYPPKPGLIVTVDCGITAVREIAWLRDTHGIDTIVTDHHLPAGDLPDALAIVNPKRSAPPEAEHMCGCATAFTLVRALARVLPEAGLYPEEELTDLVAVATVADLMEQTGDNRTLVAMGLELLRDDGLGNPGLRALMKTLHLPPEQITVERLAFALIPCINAAGRLGGNNLRKAYALLTSDPADRWADDLARVNERRREIEHRLTDMLEAQYRALPRNLPVYVFSGTGDAFHPGVLGLVASRMMDRTGKPVAVIRRLPNGGGHGSMRCYGDMNAMEILCSLRDLLDHFGGHTPAAGFTLKDGAFDEFMRRFPACFTPTSEPPPRMADADLGDTPVTLDFCRELTCLAPCGNGNPPPIFLKNYLLTDLRTVGRERAHLVLRLTDPAHPDLPPLRGVWPRHAASALTWTAGMTLRLAFHPGIDFYRPDDPVPSLHIRDAQVIARPTPGLRPTPCF